MKKMKINDSLYNVCSPIEYTTNPNLYTPKFTAIECGNNSAVLPINSRLTDTAPGVYFYPKSDDVIPKSGMVGIVNKPNRKDESEYSYDKIIDYSKAKDVEDVIYNNKVIRDIQNDIIMTSDNILSLPISGSESPQMKGLKLAINAKCIDKKQYESRFDQYQNNMRLLKGDDITLKKLIEISDAFDISLELTLKDKSGINNPIGREINVVLNEEERDGGNL